MKKNFLAALFSCLALSMYGNTPDENTVNIAALSAFGKSFGIARYYSPNPYTEKWSDEDWYKVGLYMLKEFDDNLSGEASIYSLLEESFECLAPNATFSPTQNESVTPVKKPRDYYYWEHTGAGYVKIPLLAKILYKEYRNIEPFYKTLRNCATSDANIPEAGRIYSYSVGSDVYINIPIAEQSGVFSKRDTKALLNDARSYWQNNLDQYGSAVIDRLGGISNNDLFWIADAIFRWNAIQHFYPYYAEDTLEWDDYLTEMISVVLSYEPPGTPRETIFTRFEMLRAMMHPVMDSHLMTTYDIIVNKAYGTYLGYSYLPIMLNDVENSIVVEDISPNLQTNMERGAVLKAINGKSADDVLKENMQMRSFSTEAYGRYLCLPDIISSRSPDTPMDITYVNPDGVERTETLTPSVSRVYYLEPNADYITTTPDDIFLINPLVRSATYKEFAKNIDGLKNSDGIIFDLRGYPTYDFEQILAHFIREPIVTSFISTPVSSFPNREHLVFRCSEEILEPAAEKIDVPVVFLCDEKAMSWAETILILVKGYDIGTIIGTNSCGTNGDATKYTIPVFTFNVSANRVVNVDGSRHHGIGVEPDVIVRQTLKGFQCGNDEVLNAALEYLRNN